MLFAGPESVGLILHLVVLFLSVTTFWKAAAMEEQAGLGLSALWGGLSAIVYLASWLIFSMGWSALIGGQVLLLVAIGVIRAMANLRQTRE